MKTWAALDVRDAGGSDLLLLALDDYEATAIESRGDAGAPRVRVFFADAARRDQALAGLPSEFEAQPVDVPDEDWARRSQQQLAPVTVGRITIFPSLDSLIASTATAAGPPGDSSPIHLLIQPSMGFGTGHHASTRLCLAALQTLDLARTSVVDVGTGSGVLALASLRLGATDVLGIDYDADAIQSAEENRVLNHAGGQVRFAIGDFRNAGADNARPPADVVTANLTGTVLTQCADALLCLLRPGGTLIVSGVQQHERDEVVLALAPARLIWESEEDGWIGAVFTWPSAAGA